MKSAFEKEKKNGLEKLVAFQHNMEMLTKIANEIFPFLKECFELDSWSLDFFNKEYLWSCRSYDGTYSYLSLQEIIMMSICIKIIINFLENKKDVCR